MRVLGIDLAAQPKKTYACVVERSGENLSASIDRRCEDERLLELAQGADKVGIDAPFGWPRPFVDALMQHEDHKWPAKIDDHPAAFRNSLVFRTTDKAVTATRRPLSVSTDKLGVTAMRAATLLAAWSTESPIDRTGRGKFVEVYPAAALVRWELPTDPYKGSDKGALAGLLRRLLSEAPFVALSAADRELCAGNDDAFDALIAGLVTWAAFVGLTDLPTKRHVPAAEVEGWIHLPLRRSLPFLREGASTQASAAARALARRRVEQGVVLDRAGYAEAFDDAVLPSFDETIREKIKDDLSGKGGSELVPGAGQRPKFFAAHSSAALAANAFGPFVAGDASEVRLGGVAYVGRVHLEVECPTGLRGTPPTLDCVVDGSQSLLCIESKCTESFSAHDAEFRDAYRDLMADASPPWKQEYSRLIDDPRRYRYLDAAQLLKHYLGVRSVAEGRDAVLAYVYWRPADHLQIAACCIHAAEVVAFASSVDGGDVRVVAVSYSELWDEWASATEPHWLAAHADELRERYSVSVGPSS